jgi:hypothetical protein
LIGHKAFPVPVLFSHLGVMASSGSFAHAERPSASCCTALDSCITELRVWPLFQTRQHRPHGCFHPTFNIIGHTPVYVANHSGADWKLRRKASLGAEQIVTAVTIVWRLLRLMSPRFSLVLEARDIAHPHGGTATRPLFTVSSIVIHSEYRINAESNTMHRAPVHRAPCNMHHAPCTVHRAPMHQNL